MPGPGTGANSMQPTGGNAPSFNPGNGPFDLPTTVAARGGKVILHNRSPYDINFTFNKDITRNGILLAWHTAEFDFAGKQTDTINISVLSAPTANIIAAAPFSYVVGECYAPGQPLPKVSTNAGVEYPVLPPGAIPDNVAIGTAPGPAPLAAPVGDDERVGVELFGGHDSGVYGGGNSAFLGSRSGACLFKMNNYWDGLSDKFILAATHAYQFFLTNDGIIHIRSDNGTNQIAGGTITWSADVFSISTAGAITVGTIPAGQVTAGTLISGVHLSAIFSDGGAITSDGVGKLTTTNRFNWNGTLSGVDGVIIAIQPTDAATKLYELLYKASNNHLYLENVTDAIILLDIGNTGTLSVTDLLTALNGITVSAGKQVGVNNTLSGGGVTGKFAYSDPDTSSAYTDLNADRFRIVGSYLGATNAEKWSVGLQNSDVSMHGVLNGVTRINFATGEGIQDISGGTMQLFSQLSGAADGVVVTTWTGTAVANPFSFGGQFNGAAAWVDNSGNIIAGTFKAQGPASSSYFLCSIPSTTADQNSVLDILDNTASAIRWQVGKQSHANGDFFRVVDQTHGVSSLTVAPNNGGVTASAFNGALNGNATTATSAGTAKQVDSTFAGQVNNPQVFTGTAGCGINVKDNSGSGFVEVVPAFTDSIARGIQLDYQDATATLHSGLRLDGAGNTTAFGTLQVNSTLKNSSGQIFRVSSFFSGNGAGTFSHGLGATPSWVGITETVANSTMTVGVDTVGATTVHVNVGAAGQNWFGMATD